MTSKRTDHLGMSLICIIKTTAGIIEFNKSKSDIEIKIQLGFASIKEYKGSFLLYLLSLTTVLFHTGTIILTVIILYEVWC